MGKAFNRIEAHIHVFKLVFNGRESVFNGGQTFIYGSKSSAHLFQKGGKIRFCCLVTHTIIFGQGELESQ